MAYRPAITIAERQGNAGSGKSSAALSKVTARQYSSGDGIGSCSEAKEARRG
jgi:hypothetical protein